MKTLMLSTAIAAALGAFAFSPANAAMIGKSTVVAPSATSDVACRTVEKRVRRNGVTRITRTRECEDDDRYERRSSYRDRDDDRSDRYVERREYRSRDRDDRPGLSIQLPR